MIMGFVGAIGNTVVFMNESAQTTHLKEHLTMIDYGAVRPKVKWFEQQSVNVRCR